MRSIAVPFRNAVHCLHQNSQPVHPLLYEGDNFLFNIRPRISSLAKLTDDACFEIRDDWKAAMGKEHSVAGCMDPISGNFCALIFPEAPKDRLHALTFVQEFLFIQDDIIDVATEEEVNKKSEQFLWNGDEQTNLINRVDPVKAKVLSRLLDVDKVAGAYVLEEIKKLAEVQAITRQFDFKAGTLEEYIQYRYTDLGTYLICACIGYSVVPTIAPSEVEHVLEATKIGYACAMLCNDYWSWDKEMDDFTGEGNWPASAVYLFMQQRNVDSDTAKEMVRVKTMELAGQYGEAALECTAGLPVDSPIVRWFALHDLMFAGNAFWSMWCPRYHRNLPQLHKGDVNLCTRLGKFASISAQRSPMKMSAPSSRGTEPESDSDYRTTIPGGSLSPVSTPSVESTYLAAVIGKPQPVRTEDELIVTEPYRYILPLPAKGLRKRLLKALNNWYHLHAESLEKIGDIIDTLHNASLLLDDIEDGSELRRGKPAAHTIFGPSQTINSAGYAMMLCLEKILSLDNKACLNAYIEEVKDIYVGQALDLHWTYHSKCPNKDQYFQSIEKKTGGLLRLMARLVQGQYSTLAKTSANQTVMSVSEDINYLMLLVGRYYQVRDDYDDILSAKSIDVHIQCDLDQGNFSLPLIHLIHHQEKTKSFELLSLLQARKQNRAMSPIMKLHILDMLEKAGSLEYTMKVLKDLQKHIMGKVTDIESKIGTPNVLLRELLETLWV